MSLTELEQHIFAYYVANGAKDLSMAPRFFPAGELALVIEDKIQLVTRKFGVRVNLACPKVARAFLGMMIERGGFSTVKDSLSTMHQYQGEAFLKCIQELQETNPIIQKARAAGPDFWTDTFTALSSDT